MNTEHRKIEADLNSVLAAISIAQLHAENGNWDHVKDAVYSAICVCDRIHRAADVLSARGKV